jgi:seryl-tRNA synthetase
MGQILNQRSCWIHLLTQMVLTSSRRGLATVHINLALALTKSDNQPDFCRRHTERPLMVSNGLEKFSHLEDKIYRTIELTKTLRQEKDDLERQLATVRNLGGDRQELVTQIERLLAEREAIRVKVQNMLDAVAATDPEIAEALRG